MEEIMLQIQDTLVSLDLAEQFFCCDIDACLGECCIEGDAGAPLTQAERDEIDKLLPAFEDKLLPSARERIAEAGTSYLDPDGDLVTQIVEGRNCIYTCYAPGGVCQCAIECAHNEGKTGTFRKPSSCALYPVRLTEYPTFTAVNYHRWKICSAAEKKDVSSAYAFTSFSKAHSPNASAKNGMTNCAWHAKPTSKNTDSLL